MTSSGAIFDDTWVLASPRERKRKQHEYIASIVDGDAFRILDIGGTTFFMDFRQSSTVYHMVDVPGPMAGFFAKHPGGVVFDGQHLPFGDKSYDMIILGFVLHHAAHNTISLLQQARQIARSHILIFEDLGSPEYPVGWSQRNAKHQPGGVFRDDREWRQLFELLGFELVTAVILQRGQDTRFPYHVMYHLAPSA